MDVVSMYGCGLIKDLKTRYLTDTQLTQLTSCGLIKDLKTRYSS